MLLARSVQKCRQDITTMNKPNRSPRTIPKITSHQWCRLSLILVREHITAHMHIRHCSHGLRNKVQFGRRFCRYHCVSNKDLNFLENNKIYLIRVKEQYAQNNLTWFHIFFGRSLRLTKLIVADHINFWERKRSHCHIFIFIQKFFGLHIKIFSNVRFAKFKINLIWWIKIFQIKKINLNYVKIYKSSIDYWL